MATTPGTYPGACHCGGIGFVHRTMQPPDRWSIRACQCAFCRAHGALSTSDPDGQIVFRGSSSGVLVRYTFGQHTADFMLCRRCGVYIGAVMETPRGMFGIININALNPVPASLAATVPMEYGAESAAQRTRRREQRWSPAAWVET